MSEPGNSQGYNRYAYVNNNPVNATDPGGNKPSDPNDYKELKKTRKTIIDEPEKPESVNDSSNGGNNKFKIPCGMLGGIEGVTCINVNQAIVIVKNPNAITVERLGSAYYISIVVNSHLAILVGLSIVGVESVAGIISLMNTVGIACAINSACEGEVANIIGETDEYGEQVLENFGGESQVYFSKSQGG